MKHVAIISSVSLSLKASLLVIESLEKRQILLPSYRSLPLESTAGLFNQAFCWWLNPLLIDGYKHVHSLRTLPEIDPNLCIDPNTNTRLSSKWRAWKHKDAAHSLLLVSMMHNRRAIGKAIIPRLFQTGFVFAQPFLVKRVIEFITRPNDKSNNGSVGTGLIVAYAIVYLGIALATSLTQQWTIHLVTRLRAGLVDLVYSRTLELQNPNMNEGDAITLVGTDIERITTGLRAFRELRVAAVSPAVVIISFTGAAIFVASKAAITQKAWLDKIQARVSATIALLRTMHSLKMTGLTRILTERITQMREDELKASFTFRGVLVRVVVLTFASTAMTPVASFGMYILLQIHRGYATLDPAITLMTLTLLQLLLAPVAILIDSLAGVMNAVGCFERIRLYLNSETRIDSRVYSTIHHPADRRSTHAAGTLIRSLSSSRMSEVDFGWRHSRYYLPHASSGENSAVGEIYAMSFLEQREHLPMAKPATQSSVSIHQASFGWKETEKPILKDLNLDMPRGGLTMIIGPVGSGKSTLLQTLLGETKPTGGGGYIRVAFQDAAYCQQRPWISNSTIQQNILGGFGFDPEWYSVVMKACCLTQDLDEMAEKDATTVGSNGTCLSGGQKMRIALARAIYSKKKTMIMDDVLSSLDPTTEEAVFKSLFSRDGLLKQHEVTVILSTNAMHRLPEADQIIVLGSKGTITEQGSFAELVTRPGGYLARLYLQSGTEFQEGRGPQRNDNDLPVSFTLNEALAKALPQLEAPDRGATDLTIYKYYIRTFGWTRWWIFIAICSFYGFGVVFPHAWAQIWAKHNEFHPGDRAGYYLGIYFMIGALTIVSLGASTGSDPGSLINRFSQDMELVDMDLPVSLIHTTLMTFVLTAQTLVIVSTAKYTGAALPFCVIAAYITQKYYLRTSRALRLLDIEAKSSLFNHFLETLDGLVTIRAFNWAKGYVKDLLVGGIAVVLAAVAVKTRGKVDGGLMGLALLNIVGFSSTLKQLITHWTLLETSTGAISRIRSFTSNTESEEQSLSGNPRRQMIPCPPPLYWPRNGGIRFNNVTASYTPYSNPILHGINIYIRPGQRVAIVGRSGSGKSSLIACLCKMMSLKTGNIDIDGVDTSTLSPDDIRLSLNVLPQHSFLIPGTLRDNVDPLGRAGYDDVVEALHLVGLWETVLGALPNGIDSPISGQMLSDGQKQMLCLARALVRAKHSPVLVLDEATSSVDLETEHRMQRVIDEQFKAKTIIAIAHHLETILDFDLVMFMECGRIVELGEPRSLLARDSLFRGLYRDTASNSRTTSF
ncbi:P-loop containing nucleoside triphosphate hydrolase protein [Periconia macrospinosa]|uniref:P-loop containing nucleoside triphosphate hydrolase protein n=1 Tax=Periconia macrospinosa TaxID=97972 RepID=A0A2V1E8X6_9PLEO|nr:P-loop containing nucleoside triphosphate hydrolase protein [Periconia macrospinosa]